MMVAAFVSSLLLLLVFSSNCVSVSCSSRAVVDLPKCCPHHQVRGIKYMYKYKIAQIWSWVYGFLLN